MLQPTSNESLRRARRRKKRPPERHDGDDSLAEEEGGGDHEGEAHVVDLKGDIRYVQQVYCHQGYEV